MTKYDVCARLEIAGREKPVWPKTGFVITVKDDGKVTLYDARTGQTYYGFERKPAEAKPAENKAAFNDTIPF